MRPLRLDLHGFTVFREPTTVRLHRRRLLRPGRPDRLRQVHGARRDLLRPLRHRAALGRPARASTTRWPRRQRRPGSGWSSRPPGARFVATRVVRRDGKGRVSTSHAGLELLPPGFDLATLDAALAERATLGSRAGRYPGRDGRRGRCEAVGLPYEQFTSCVVLPQGAVRRVPARQAGRTPGDPGQPAGPVASTSGSATRPASWPRTAEARRCGQRPDARRRSPTPTDEAIAAAPRAGHRHAIGSRRGVDATLPALVARPDAGPRPRTPTWPGSTSELRALARGHWCRPTSPGSPRTRPAARQAPARPTPRCGTAEEHEEKLRAELAAAGDAAALHRLLDEHAERDRLAAQAGASHATLEAAPSASTPPRSRRSSRRWRGRPAPPRPRGRGRAGVTRRAQTADRAASLRPHLRRGRALPGLRAAGRRRCPPCPTRRRWRRPRPGWPGGAAGAAELATVVTRARPRRPRAGPRAGRRARPSRDQAGGRAWPSWTPGWPARPARADTGPPLGQDRRGGSAPARRGRRGGRAAREAPARGAGPATSGPPTGSAPPGRASTLVRDAVAPLGPPPADRDELAGAWRALAAWAAAAGRRAPSVTARAAGRDGRRRATQASHRGALAGDRRRCSTHGRAAGTGAVPATVRRTGYRAGRRGRPSGARRGPPTTGSLDRRRAGASG